LEFHYQDL